MIGFRSELLILYKHMTQDQFQNKHIGRYLDYDGSYGSQCVDLMRAFTKEVCGFLPYVAIPTTGYAKNIYKNFVSNKYFQKIPNTPSGIPKRGDIIFWGTYPFVTGIAGHVGIVESATLYEFVVFNQNYPTGMPCTFRRFSYKGVLGWLHKK